MIASDLNSSTLNKINVYDLSFLFLLKRGKMNYSKECVKKAIEYSLVQSPRTTLMKQLIWHRSQTVPPATSSVYKSLWKKNKLGIVSAIALSVIAIAFPIFCLHYLKSPYHNLPLDKADPNRVMATDIKSIHDISNLKQINGLNISIIEERARPNNWSDIGFIGKEDNLLDILQKDWKTVDALGTTHIELADHLKSIYDKAFRENNKGSISYDFNTIKGNTINNSSSIKQFDVKIQITQGWQNDIFDPCIDPNFYDCYRTFKTPINWGTDLFLTNPKNKEYIHVTDGVIKYIKKYGFYESGKENYYRIDPIRLASVFTGNSYCSIAKAINQSCNSIAPNDPYYRLN